MNKVNIEVNGVKVATIEVSECNTSKEIDDMVMNYLENKVEWEIDEE